MLVKTNYKLNILLDIFSLIKFLSLNFESYLVIYIKS
jgi:hypothetical protein